MSPSAADRERTCIVTRQAGPAGAMIRFVASPDGVVVPDLRERLPGRGAWVTAERARVATAVKQRRLQKALGVEGPVSPDLPDEVERLMLSAAAGALSMARKAGEAVAGFARVEEALTGARAIALIHAPRAGEDGQAKLAAAARRTGGSEIAVLRCFGPAQLDLAFGRTNVIHAALLAGPAGDNALQRARAVARYRGDRECTAGTDNPTTRGASPTRSG